MRKKQDRNIKNQYLNRIINDAYFSFKEDTRYPIVVIKITADPILVDVNIHPSKQDIKFSNFEDLKNTQKQVNLEYLNLDNAGVKGNLDLSNCNKLIEIDLSRNILLNNIIFSTKTNNNLISLKLGSGNSGSIGCNLKTLNTSTFPNLKILDLRFNNIENRQG